MGLMNRIVEKISNRVLDLATDKLREMLTDAIRKAEAYAKTTANPYDDMIVDAIRRELKIPTLATEEKIKAQEAENQEGGS